MTTNLNAGIYGAKVQSWRKANPRDLLKRLIEENNRADRNTILRLFRKECQADEALIDSIVEYWFANNYHSLTERPYDRRSAKAVIERTERRENRVAEIKRKVQEKIQQEALFLLDTMLPHGKPLRDSTFGECSRIGGALAVIGASGRPRQIVGKYLSNEQLQKIQSA